MCYKGFFATFGLALRIGEAIRMPIMSLCERHKLKPRKKRCVLPLMTLDFRAAVKDAYEELIGRFVQGPPEKPTSAVWTSGGTISSTDGITWTVMGTTSTVSDSNDTISNDTIAPINWDNVINNNVTNTVTIRYDRYGG